MKHTADSAQTAQMLNNPSVSHYTQQAMACYQQGIFFQLKNNLEQAEEQFTQAVALHPFFAEAFNNRGIVFYLKGQFNQAITNYDQAITLKSDYSEAFNNRGVALQCLHRSAEALSCYRKAIKLNPSYREALCNLGSLLNEMGHLQEALLYFDQALASNPSLPELWNDRGSVLQDLGHWHEALQSYNQVLHLNPHYVEAFNNRGTVLHALGRYDEALTSYDNALSLKNNYSEAWNNRGNVLRDQKKYKEALTSYDQALLTKPDYIQAFNNKGYTLHLMQAFEEAINYFDTALTKHNETYVHTELEDIPFSSAVTQYRRVKALLLRNRGNTLASLKRYEHALNDFDASFSCNPSYLEAINNKAAVLWEMHRYGEALACYDRAILQEPHYAGHRYNKSLLEIALGIFKSGWENYECRLRLPSLKESLNITFLAELPRWDGKTSLKDKTLFIAHEQSLSHAIQFCRYATLLVHQYEANVVFETPAVLFELMQTLGSHIHVVKKGDPISHPIDTFIPLMSLPYVCSTSLQTLPVLTYLSAPSLKDQKYPFKMIDSSENTLKIGLAWPGISSNKNHANQLSFEKFSTLCSLTHQHAFYSLNATLSEEEKQFCKRNEIRCSSNALTDYAITATALSSMDLIITADKTIAHLAGALGKPVWVLLPFTADWRWLLDESITPWYPTATLFRQKAVGQWDDVIAEIEKALINRNLR